MEDVIKFLKKNGTYAIIHEGNMVFFVKEGFWGVIVWEKSSKARTENKMAFVKKMDDWSWAKVVYPENWSEVRKELEEML